MHQVDTAQRLKLHLRLEAQVATNSYARDGGTCCPDQHRTSFFVTARALRAGGTGRDHLFPRVCVAYLHAMHFGDQQIKQMLGFSS